MTSKWQRGSEAAFANASSDGLEYDLDTYRRLLEGLLDAGYEFVGFDGEIDDDEIALRHDVDLSVERAVEMARLEASMGISATYCFLVTAPAYDLLSPVNRRRVRCILDAGHDVGLHFDPHHYWEREPDEAELQARVEGDSAVLERVIDDELAAVSIHIPPEWALDVDFEGFESTYAPRYFSDVGYVSDSSQKWTDGHPFDDGVPDAMQLLVHPGLWHDSHRSLTDVVEGVRDRRTAEVDHYLDDIGP